MSLLTKKCRIGKLTVKWIGKHLNSWVWRFDQRHEVQLDAYSAIFQAQYWGPTLVYIFINALDDEAECIFNRFIGHAKGDRMDDVPDHCAAIQRDTAKH